MKLFALEGNTQKLDGGAMYGNAPRALWEKWSPPDAANRISLACRALLVQHDGKKILFETGIGSFFEPKLKERFGVVEPDHVLLTSLKQLGLQHTDIDYVVLSHLHFDHAGGMLSPFEEGKQPTLLFPKAQILVGKSHWARAKAPHPRDRASFVPILNEQLESSGRLCLVDSPEGHPLASFVRMHFSDGHTPGLMMAEIATDQGPMVFASDLIPGMPWIHTAITMGYDRFPEMIVNEKQELLADLVQRKGSLFFTHDPQTARARVCKDSATGKYFGQPLPLS